MSRDARVARGVLLSVALFSSLGANYRTDNFVVSTSSPELAQVVAESAEQFRRELSLEWLGYELPKWGQPCPIVVRVDPQLGAGGATSFYFANGEVYGWDMKIQGSRQRVLDSVLPHEVTHTIFASHFRQPLPRWADEGACTTVEHPAEKTKHRHMLVRFLQTQRGIAFSRMFGMKEYPRDVLPLYAQGYSLASFLIDQGGKKKFIKFVEDGVKTGAWVEATNRHYQYASLAALQNSWLGWVKQGSPLKPDSSGGIQLVSNQTPSTNAVDDGGWRQPQARPEPNLIYHTPRNEPAAQKQLVPVGPAGGSRPDPIANEVAPSSYGQPIANADTFGRPPAATRPAANGQGLPLSQRPPIQSPAKSPQKQDSTQGDAQAAHRNPSEPWMPGGTSVLGGLPPNSEAAGAAAARTARLDAPRKVLLEWSRDASASPPARTYRPPMR